MIGALVFPVHDSKPPGRVNPVLRVLAAEVSEAALLDGLRRGRSFVTFDYLGDPAGFAFRYGEWTASSRGSWREGSTAASTFRPTRTARRCRP